MPFGPTRARELRADIQSMSSEEREFIQNLANTRTGGDLDAAFRLILNSTLCEGCLPEEHQAMHTGTHNRCCRHHVEAGGAPADWHPECMKAGFSVKLHPDKTLKQLVAAADTLGLELHITLTPTPQSLAADATIRAIHHLRKTR